MKFPIGIQSFESLRSEGYVYVDKTALVKKLVSEGKSYFLGRPRRFGKSLLMSTIEAYFKGKRHLFEGLAMMELETEWKEYPVLHLDLNAKPYTKLQDLYDLLEDQLTYFERQYDSVATDKSPEGRFRQLIRSAKQKTGRGVVVLVDEYDKPILQATGNEALQDEFRNALKAFYGVLKSADADLRFTLLTGVTKFGKVSVFSDLNNLKDISTSPHFHNICGISESELNGFFDEQIGELAIQNGQTKEDAYRELKCRYDGYHFCENSEGLYNPFSLLWTLSENKYGSYWFSTGTPTYLVELLKKSDFHLEEFSNLEVSHDELDSIHQADINPIPVLFQSGYLTIKGVNKEFELYRLDFPNEEVREGFVKFLLPYYVYCRQNQHKTIISKFVMALRNGEADLFMQLMQSLMAGTPYELIRELENHYQNVMFIITKLMGFYVQAEYRTSNGRIDLMVGTDKYVYIIELKFNGAADDALAQIDAKDYSLPFNIDGRQVIKIGANVSGETRNLEEWRIGVGSLS